MGEICVGGMMRHAESGEESLNAILQEKSRN